LAPQDSRGQATKRCEVEKGESFGFCQLQLLRLGASGADERWERPL
jgi:hypothetical protein